MDNSFLKCSSKLHKNDKATSYCQDCRIYMCEKCQKMHLEYYTHNQININENENQKDIFTGICKEENHINYLDFYCKTHNKLCCLACISKINKKGYGQHKDCDICIIEDIKEEKRLKFKENIKEFENLSNTVNISINQLKKTFEEINNKKEEMKIKIQKIFTKFRNELNNREDELLLMIDNKFNNSFIKEDNIKNFEKLPNQITKVLEEIKLIDKDWDINKLNYFLNYCNSIENNINNIKKENESLQSTILSKIYSIYYNPKETEVNEIVEKIKSLGDIYYEFEFKSPEKELNKEPEYIISGDKNNIATKLSTNPSVIRILTKNILEPQKEYNLKIKIIKSKSKKIMVGIAQVIPEIINTHNIANNMNIGPFQNTNMLLSKKYLMFHFLKKHKINLISNYGWYYSLSSSSLYSDKPHKYRGQVIDLNNNIIEDEIKININMKDGSINLIFNNDNKLEIYNKIPLDKPISPSILLFDENDSVEIIKC